MIVNCSKAIKMEHAPEESKPGSDHILLEWGTPDGYHACARRQMMRFFLSAFARAAVVCTGLVGVIVFYMIRAGLSVYRGQRAHSPYVLLLFIPLLCGVFAFTALIHLFGRLPGRTFALTEDGIVIERSDGAEEPTSLKWEDVETYQLKEPQGWDAWIDLRLRPSPGRLPRMALPLPSGDQARMLFSTFQANISSFDPDKHGLPKITPFVAATMYGLTMVWPVGAAELTPVDALEWARWLVFPVFLVVGPGTFWALLCYGRRLLRSHALLVLATFVNFLGALLSMALLMIRHAGTYRP